MRGGFQPDVKILAERGQICRIVVRRTLVQLGDRQRGARDHDRVVQAVDCPAAGLLAEVIGVFEDGAA